MFSRRLSTTVVNLQDFARYTADIIKVHKSVRKERCTLYSLTLLIRSVGSSTQLERDNV